MYYSLYLYSTRTLDFNSTARNLFAWQTRIRFWAGAPAEGGGGEGARPNERGNQVGTGLEDGEAAALSRENLGSHLGEILS